MLPSKNEVVTYLLTNLLTNSRWKNNFTIIVCLEVRLGSLCSAQPGKAGEGLEAGLGSKTELRLG